MNSVVLSCRSSQPFSAQICKIFAMPRRPMPLEAVSHEFQGLLCEKVAMAILKVWEPRSFFLHLDLSQVSATGVARSLSTCKLDFFFFFK